MRLDDGMFPLSWGELEYVLTKARRRLYFFHGVFTAGGEGMWFRRCRERFYVLMSTG